MDNVIVKKVLISCNLTPEQLELYDHKDSQEAANQINEAIMEALNSDWMKHEEQWSAIYKVMKKFKHCGAMDSEVYNRIDAIFHMMK